MFFRYFAFKRKVNHLYGLSDDTCFFDLDDYYKLVVDEYNLQVY